MLFQYHTVDSVRAKDTWNLADYAGHYFAGVIAGQVLALCAIPAGWLIGRALGPRRLVALAPILGPAAVLVATGLVALAAPSIQVLETSDAEDLIPSLLIVMVPVGVALGLVVRRSAGRLVGAFAQ